jgi:hypothetical protein
VDRSTKIVHFIPVNVRYFLEKLDQLYIKEIVHLHEVLSSIVSDRDSRFTSRFLGNFQESLGSNLNFNMSTLPQTDGQSESSNLNFNMSTHPQTDGQLERVIQILEDTLRACMLGFENE